MKNYIVGIMLFASLVCGCAGDDSAPVSGDRGLTGQAGPAGPEGKAGKDGAVGPQGPTGAQGPAGDTGSQGPAGVQGAAGPQGPQGVPGAAGAAGPQGAQGTAGPQGVQGPVGPQGAQGDPGISSITKSSIYKLPNFIGATCSGNKCKVTASCADANDVLLHGGCEDGLTGSSAILMQAYASSDEDPSSPASWTCQFNTSQATGLMNAFVTCLDVP